MYDSWIYNSLCNKCLWPLTTKIVSLNPTQGKVYSIQLQMYVIKFVSDLLQVIGFLWVPRFPPPKKLIATIKWNIVASGIKHHDPNPYFHPTSN